MYQGLIKEVRPYTGGTARLKLVRPPGAKPPSQDAGHRRAYVAATRLKCIQALGGKCCKCGFEDVRALQIDHVFGDGKDERRGPNKKSGGSYYHHIWKSIESGRYQVLCANCNVIKRAENQECPRKEVA